MNVRAYMRITFCLFVGCLLAAGFMLLLNLANPNAWASTGALFASTTGTGTDCTQGNPCSLQTALGQAVDSDSLFVAGGTYTSTSSISVVHISNKSFTLYGGWDGAASGAVLRDPDTYPTILDGEGQRRVVYISGNSSPTLDGFTIANGLSGEAAGIALFVYDHPNATPVIRNCVITNNVATGGWGGGILIDGGRPIIEHNRIMSNTTPYEGGGVGAAFGSHLTLENNLIAGNSALVSGAGVRLRDTWTTLRNNTIAYNSGTGGDGIYVTNTTITLTDNIIVSNTYGLRTAGTITETITFNDVWRNSTSNYSGLPDPTSSDGNISLDPIFVSGPHGDYYLSQLSSGQALQSPCVDAGSDLAVNIGLQNRTTRTDKEVDSGIVDMGFHYRAVRRILLPLVLKS